MFTSNSANAEFLVNGSLAMVGLIVFIILIAATEIGYRIATRHHKGGRVDDVMVSGAATLTGGMLALVAFMLGLAINFAQSRYELRRSDVLLEANAIGTAWLRARLIGGDEGEAVAALIVDYTKVRLAYTKAGEDGPIRELLDRTNEMQTQIWQIVTPLARRSQTPVMAIFLASLNDMFDSATSQRFAFVARVPLNLVYSLLGGSAIALGAIGYQFGLSARRQTVMTILLLAMWTGAIVLIIDFSRPRIGTLRVDTGPLEWTLQGLRNALEAVRLRNTLEAVRLRNTLEACRDCKAEHHRETIPRPAEGPHRMQPPNSLPSQRYTGMAILLHWLVAILVIANLILVWTVDYASDDVGAVMIHTHKSFGITVLGLAILRLLWRWANPPPPLPSGTARLERFAAGTAHVLLYALIFALPLSGWLEDSAWDGAAANPTMLYGLVEWPHIGPIFHMEPAAKERLHTVFETAHTIFGYGLYALLALHLAGALKHQFLDRQPSLQRMWPGT
eukprot:gene5338-5391_t